MEKRNPLLDALLQRPGDEVMGYPIRKPSASEVDYFLQHRDVAGMAAEDGAIVLNPYSSNSPEEQMAVAKNEAMRLWMRENNVQPDFEVTPEQEQQFAGTEYGKPESAIPLRQTLLARMLSGDPSAGKTTKAQQDYAKRLSDAMRLGKR